MITIFVILAYILLSISVWVRSVEASERIYAESYKESTVELAIMQLTPEKVDALSQKILYRALFRINEESVTNPVKPGSGDTEFENVEAAFSELFINGSASADYFESGEGLAPENSSMSVWVRNMNASLLAIGMHIDDFIIYDFHISQSSPYKLNYSYKMNLSMSDVGKRTQLSRTYNLSNNISILGIIDPAIARGTFDSTDGSQTAYRAFYFNDDYEMPSSISTEPILAYDALYGGQGWFYGYVRDVSDASDILKAERKKYILVGSFNDIRDADPFEQFGGYILTNDPYAGAEGGCSRDGFTYRNQRNTFMALTYDGPGCEASFVESTYTDIPFIEAEDFRVSSALSCPKLWPVGSEDERCALFISPYSHDEIFSNPGRKTASGAGIYNIEEIRDFIMCGYYTHSEDAPSYMQRLFQDSYDRSSEPFGIETFVIGEYANSSSYEGLSRLDRNLLQEIGGHAVRGLPGCRQYEHCSGSPSTGVFVLDADAAGPLVYDVADAYCERSEGCDE